MLQKQSVHAHKIESFKYRLGCQDRINNTAPSTDSWLKIQSILVSGHPVLKGVLEKRKDVVVKFGNPVEMRKEYAIDELIQAVPNMLKYYCVFACNDTVDRLQMQDYRFKPYLCEGTGDSLGCLVMPYYPMGSVDGYHWRLSNLDILKNILKQVAMASLHAYERHNFIHNDMHLMNILIRRSKKASIDYGDKTLQVVGGHYAIVMDYGKSQIATDKSLPRDVYAGIHRMMRLIGDLSNSDVQLDYDTATIRDLMSNNVPITPVVYTLICRNIDDLKVVYEKNKKPPMPDFSSPNWNLA